GSPVDDIKIKKGLLGGIKREAFVRGFIRSDAASEQLRENIRIGMPKALNMWSTGPFWRAYFEALGIKSRNIVFSDDTSEEMWQAGGKYGSIDPCYPAKVSQAHIHNLLFVHHEEKPLNFIFFPALTHIPTFVESVMDTACCPIVAGTPKVMGAAFTKEQDYFGARNITYLDPALSLNEPLLLKNKMWQTFAEHLHISEDENNFAVDEAFKAWHYFDEHMQSKGRMILDAVAEQNRIAILMIGRPYHNDPGMNHSVLEEYQAMGYPILSMRSIPKDKEYLAPYFAEDLKLGHVSSALDISDVWPENYSVNSVQKVWAAKFASRHPNVAVLDLSSFKCGHDAPTYGLIDRIIGANNSPYSALHDIDANKPSGSIKIRVKTYGYTLKINEEKLEDAAKLKKQAHLERIKQRMFALQQAPQKIRSDPLIVAELEKCRQELAESKEQYAANDQGFPVKSMVEVITPQLIAAVEID
ncbi:MAG: CoA activase, partial [Moraxellaceae bacterium]